MLFQDKETVREILTSHKDGADIITAIEKGGCHYGRPEHNALVRILVAELVRYTGHL